jgi:hypothetical protein
MVLKTIACRTGLLRDRMYGVRKLKAGGMVAGRIDIRVTNIGAVWYGRNVTRVKLVLYSWILRPYR